MKKIILSLVMLLTLAGSFQVAKAMTYTEGLKNSKPMVLLIYADWADDKAAMIEKLNAQEKKYGDLYNFVMLNIASEDAKEFNKKYHIYPNLPYVLLYKDSGKISRYLQKNCVLDDSCFAEKLDFFIR